MMYLWQELIDLHGARLYLARPRCLMGNRSLTRASQDQSQWEVGAYSLRY